MLVLDEHLTAPCDGLRARGLDVRPVHDFGATSTLDPDLIRMVAAAMHKPWVLVTLDSGIKEEHRKFEWERYAIAWVLIPTEIKGIAVEHAKTDVVHRHAHRIVEQRADDHFSYTRRARHKSPPSLVSVRSRH